MSKLPLRFELNATRRPSGDHVGSPFRPLDLVSCQICSLLRGREIAEESGADVSVRMTTVPTAMMAIVATATIVHNNRGLLGGGGDGVGISRFGGGGGLPRRHKDHRGLTP